MCYRTSCYKPTTNTFSLLSAQLALPVSRVHVADTGSKNQNSQPYEIRNAADGLLRNLQKPLAPHEPLLPEPQCGGMWRVRAYRLAWLGACVTDISEHKHALLTLYTR